MGNRYSPTVTPVPFDLGAALTPIGELADKWHEDRRIARAQKLQIDQAQAERTFRQQMQTQSELHDSAEAGLNRTERRTLQLGQFTHEDKMQGAEITARATEGAADRTSHEKIAGDEDKTRRYLGNLEHTDRASALSSEDVFRGRQLGLEGIRLGAEMPRMAAEGRHADALARWEDKRGGVTADDYAKFAHAVAPYGMTGDSTENAQIDRLAHGYQSLVGNERANALAAPSVTDRSQAPIVAPQAGRAAPVIGLDARTMAHYIKEQTTPDMWEHAILTTVPPEHQKEVRDLLSGGGD